MVTLTGYAFETVDGAEKMLSLIKQCRKQALIDLHDVAAVWWREETNRPQTKHLGELAGDCAMGNAFWGMLFGLIFFVPFLGMAVGAAMGALSGYFSTYGIDKAFIKTAQEHITPGTSALFLMSSATVRNQMSDALRRDRLDFHLFYTNLTNEQAQQLFQDFGTSLQAE